MHLKMSSGKWRPFCLGLNVLSTDVSLIWPSFRPTIFLIWLSFCPTIFPWQLFMSAVTFWPMHHPIWKSRADSRFAPRQWEMALLCNDVSHWPCACLESALNECWHHWQTTKNTPANSTELYTMYYSPKTKLLGKKYFLTYQGLNQTVISFADNIFLIFNKILLMVILMSATDI